jgi:hypothetical protein
MNENRWIFARIIESVRKRDAAREAGRRRELMRETTATLMLGSASVALASVMLVVTSLGFSGIGFQPWSEPRELIVQAATIRRGQKLVTVYVPSRECDLLAFVGLVLGGIGIALSVRRRRFSWLSAIGFSVTLGMMAIVVARGAMTTVVP